jgi:opacity protein-like surface antigen
MSRNVIGRSVLAFAFLTLVGLPALAQGQDQRGYITGFGGAGATTELTSLFFGGSVGADVSRNVQITADFGRMQRVLPKFTNEDLRLTDQQMLSEEGLITSSTVKVPTNFLSGGFRLHAANGRTIRPYVLVHAGIAHMSPKPRFTVEGLDITSLVLSDTEDPTIRKAFREETRPMATLGGGVTAKVADHVLVDVGYKYSGIFIKTDYLQDVEGSPHSHKRIDTHRVYVGLGLTF